MEKMNFTRILINSTLAFVSAFILTTIFHEFGHYFSYSLFGYKATLFHNFVQTTAQNPDINATIISTAAGPFFSLIQGLIFAFITFRNKSNSSYDLLTLWLSLLGFVNFFGYLVMTPFTTTGDTGKIALLLNFAFSLKVIIAVIALFALILIILKLARNFSYFIPKQSDRAAKAKYIYHIMFFPIILGSLINALLALPIVAILSLIYPATSPYVIMSSFPAILKSSNQNTTIPEFETKIMKSLLILALCSITINRLLTLGIG